jgi:hypothetical protein
MRPLLHRLTPTQLVWFSVASNGFIALGFGVLFVLSLRLPSATRMPFAQKLPGLALILFGLVGDVLAERALRRGIATERWHDTLLAAPRKLLAQPVVSILSWSLLAAALAVIIFSRGQYLAEFMLFLAPQMGLNRIRISLKQPNSVATDPGLPRPTQPLQSEHWGTPPQPTSN